MGRELTSRIAAPMSGLLKCPGASPWNGMTIPLNGYAFVGVQGGSTLADLDYNSTGTLQTLTPDSDGDGVISAVEGDIDTPSNGFADNTRLFLPATAFNRFAVTREINDGLLAPRFSPSTQAWVLSGTRVSVNPAVPADLEAVVLRLLAKRPEDRFQTADELVSYLEAQQPAAKKPGS